MKATLTFNLPDEREEFKDACDGTKSKIIIEDILNLFRSKLKYEELSEVEYEILEKMREAIIGVINDA